MAHNDDNENDRIVSAFILENKNLLGIFYLKGSDKYILKTYDYDLDPSGTEVEVGTTSGYPGGEGLFFKALVLDNNYIAVIYYPKYDNIDNGNNNKIDFKLYQHESSFTQKFHKEMSYTSRNAYIRHNDFIS